jgi:coenzyme F420-dependent oxidoreductase
MTTARDVYLPVAAQPSMDTLTDLAQLGEANGYRRLWLPETWGRDAVTTLSVIAERTESIGVGTSIANVFSRSPALLGQTAATMQEVTDERVRLGVGPSGPIVVEGWHGASFEAPLRQTRETIEIIKQVVGGERLDYDGEIYQLSGFELRFEPPTTEPAVDAGGLGPKSVELAGRFGDGWHALMLTREGLRERLVDFDRGSELGDRSRADQRVTFSVPTCALDDAERARRLMRQHLAFYVGGMGTFYREALARQGFEETANTIAQQWANGERGAAMEAIDDSLLDALAAAGTPETCREQLDRFAAVEGVDAISVSFPRGASTAEVEATVEAVAPGQG